MFINADFYYSIIFWLLELSQNSGNASILKATQKFTTQSRIISLTCLNQQNRIKSRKWAKISEKSLVNDLIKEKKWKWINS